MIYSVRHRTTYAYRAEVTFARCVLRLTPRTSPDQSLISSRIDLSPTPSSSATRVGASGEEVRQVVVTTPHRNLVIDANSQVDVHTPPIAFTFRMAWEAVRARALEGTDLAGPAAFLAPTARTPLVAEITDYARSSFGPGRGVFEAASELMGRIRADFRYDPEATDVSTPAAEAFAARHGVCQDFAHIMICGLRGLGLPAAYVSGYLMTGHSPRGGELVGSDATHAWVQVWCGPAAGWVGFDPTNAVIVADRHIVLAVGRDYADVAPIDGVILAPGKQTLSVEVAVREIADAAA